MKQSSDKVQLITRLSAVSAIVYIIASTVINAYIRNMTLPESYIGIIGLLEIKEYLTVYFWLKIINIILFFLIPAMLCLMIITSGKENGFIKNLKGCLTVTAAAFLVFGIPTSTERNQFDWQMNQNQYHGTLMMKTYALIQDIEQDLKENTTRTVSRIPVCTSQDFKYHVPGKGGGHDVHVLEYAVYTSDNEEYISQISRKDYAEYHVLFRGDTPHEIKLYLHSGFIASVD